MRIIVDIPVLPETHSSLSGNFLREIVFEMAKRYAHHSFIYIARSLFPKFDGLPGNVSVHYPNKIFSKWFGRKFGTRYLLTKELNSLGADLYVTADNSSLRKTHIPVFLFLVRATEILQQVHSGRAKGSAGRRLQNSIQHADALLTFSQHDRQTVESLQKKDTAKLNTLLPHPGDVPELKWTEKEMVKIDFAGGVEYFAFAGDLDEKYDLITLLKSFSQFKKWQQSSMRLVIAGSRTAWTEKFEAQLASFKYRDDVHLVVNPGKADLDRIISGAYALVYPAVYDNLPLAILTAMQTSIPVISSSLEVCKEWCGETIMYPETYDAAGFTACMQMMYKDERMRSVYIASAKERLSELPKIDLVEACMNFFEETIAK